jgi:hypothetical protein
VKVNKHIIDPFNRWWRTRQSAPPQSVVIIEAFEAGFMAGIDAAKAVIETHPSCSSQNPSQGD